MRFLLLIYFHFPHFENSASFTCIEAILSFRFSCFSVVSLIGRPKSSIEVVGFTCEPCCSGFTQISLNLTPTSPIYLFVGPEVESRIWAFHGRDGPALTYKDRNLTPYTNIELGGLLTPALWHRGSFEPSGII